MNELDAILEARRGLDAGNAVLATVVHVAGSAYRRPGARMLLLPDGSRIGTISGGCLEGEVCRKAWWFTEDGRPTLRVYDTTSNDDAVWEFGLGCNGVVHVLLERLGSDGLRRSLDFVDECRAARREAVVATVIRSDRSGEVEVGDRLWLDDGAIRGGELRDSALAPALQEHAHAALRQRRSRLWRSQGVEVFLEWIGRPLRLVVFGAGHDAMPLVTLASELGWRATVADGRPAYARADRFPHADRVVLLRAGVPLGGVEVGADDVVVVMTHNFPLDATLLPDLLAARPAYLGLLGPIRRAERLFAEIGEDLGEADVHAPIGLDIGADTPEAIALSIVAEIQAALSSRAGGKLRHRRGPIHAPVEEVGERGLGPPLETQIPYCALASGDG